MVHSLRAVLIAGPTASGKSALALDLARAVDGEIVNADSMQVYRDLRVLSARPSRAEEAAVPHHLYGFVDGAVEYSVGAYVRAARSVLGEIAARGRPAIVVGGTGLYFRALTEGLVETPPIAVEIRAALAAEIAAGADPYALLEAEDPERAAQLPAADRPRILRALEVVRQTGRTLGAWQAEGESAAILPAGSWTGLFLNPPRAALIDAIDTRFAAMIGQGAIEEVQALAARALPANRGVMKAHGVPHLVRYLQGALPIEDAIVLGAGDTRRYAKRQVTWARRFMADWRWASDAAMAREALAQRLAGRRAG